ncbi:MAG: amidohydrolase [Saprospiraceae bacterium]|nr:amidohydrolase [Saprospiraceae bacterium]
MYKLSFFLLLLCACTQQEYADLLLQNGTIYTMQTPGAKVEALAVKGDRIVFAGARQEAEKYLGPHTQVVDLHGKTVLPGFTDAHVHPVAGGLAFLECDLADITTPDTILERLRIFARQHPEKSWVRGENFWLPAIENGNPHKNLLDAICPDRPMYVSSADGHSVWVNSKALALAGITAQTPDPANGRIERDPKTGEPTGTLREDAITLVSQHIPPYTNDERLQALRKALRMANSLGLTNLVEASADADLANTYLALSNSGELTAHVSISLYCDISKGSAGAREVIALNEKLRKLATPDVRFDQVKLFMDGVVEGKTAAMLNPYQHEHNDGIANCPPDTARVVVAMLDKAGLQVHVHAIGDRGIRQTLDAFEHAAKENGKRDSRHHIAHLHVIHPDDIARFAALGVTANFQALWATLEDTYMTDMNFPFLGPERSEWQYPVGSVARSGARLAFGSDWPVSTMNPFYAAQVAVTRRGPDSLARSPWTPQHLIDLGSVLDGYTRGGAWLSFLENESGVLEAGKLADLIVLDQDVFKCSNFQLYQTKVMMTIFRGKTVWTTQ